MPKSVQALTGHADSLLSRIKITKLLMDVDDWTGFTRQWFLKRQLATVTNTEAGVRYRLE